VHNPFSLCALSAWQALPSSFRLLSAKNPQPRPTPKRLLEEQKMKMPSQPETELVRYWLCCGSTDPGHEDRGTKRCMEAKMGHKERCRFGTSSEHSEWQIAAAIRSND
jgi:hypothetical protein